MIIRKEIKPDNTFGGNYPTNINYRQLPEKFILISEEQQVHIDSNLDTLLYCEGQDGIFQNPKGVVDISSTEEYLVKRQEAETIKRQTDIKNQILEIETLQARAIREILLNNTEYSRLKLQSIEEQIQTLRSQL